MTRTVDDVLREEIELAQGQYARSIKVDTLRNARDEILTLRAERDALRAAVRDVMPLVAGAGWCVQWIEKHAAVIARALGVEG